MIVSCRQLGSGFCQGRCGRVCFDGQIYVMYLYVYMYMCMYVYVYVYVYTLNNRELQTSR